MAVAKGLFLFLALLRAQIVTTAPQTQEHGYPESHKQQLEHRAVVSSTSSHLSPTTSHLSSTTSSKLSIPVLTIITIRAKPIRITEQRQLVTSYNPIMTICPLAGKALPLQPIFPTSGLPTASVNGTNATLHSRGISPDLAAKPIRPRQVANVSTCSVFWEPIPTPICHTVLSPLAAPLILVTACHQSVTFSSQFGYEVASGTVSPQIETLTTYYVAPWSDLSAGSVPTKGVIAEVCCSGRTCTTGKERWDTQLSEYTQSSKKTVSVRTTVVGPVAVIIDPAIDPITIGGGSPSSVYITTVVETTQTSTTTIIVKATASSDEAAAATSGGATPAESTSLVFADEVATVSSTTTSVVTVVLDSSTETLPLPTRSN